MVTDRGLPDWEKTEASGLRRDLETRGWVPNSRRLDATEAEDALGTGGRAVVLEHEPVPFVSYPFEWSFAMLRAAALHHLAVLELALDHGMSVKDGSAYNIQFVGPRPIFIDLLSFTQEQSGRLWHGHRQFCEHFLFPLMLSSHTGVPFQPWLRSRLEGLDVENLARLLGLRRFFDRDLLFHVVLQRKLVQALADDPRAVRSELEELGDLRGIVRRSLRGLASAIAHLRAPKTPGRWGTYAEDCHYAADDRRQKQEFVRRHLEQLRPKLVWDIGANTGEYALIAAEHSDYVVAIDSDEGAIDRMYNDVVQRGAKNLLPLIVDALNPTPAQGWRLVERATLEGRGRPDAALVLGFIHHAVLNGNVPLPQFVDWLCALSPSLLVEFVTKEDPKARLLLRNKDDQYADYDLGTFERLVTQTHRIVERVAIAQGTRVLFALRGKPGDESHD